MPDDLLIIMPTRNRADQAAEMLGQSLRLSRAGADFAVCYDEDDPQRAAYDELARVFPGQDRVHWICGPRRSLAGWTNLVAEGETAARYRLLGSFGDDHFPRTEDWDGRLAGAIGSMGGTGIAYGNDLHHGAALPTAPVISRDIITATGWFFLPGAVHGYFSDDAWKDLGERACCLAYLDDVIIEHRHPDAGKARRDVTYDAAMPGWAADQAAYAQWCGSSRRDEDVARVRELARQEAR